MTETNYPIVEDTSQLVEFAQEITRLRQEEDIANFDNLPNRFVRGRTTTRIPSTPGDVLPTDNEGDIVADVPNGFEYKLVDNAGTLIWDRRTLDISW